MIPTPPIQVIAQTGNQQNLISWQATLGATSYSIERSTDGVNFVALGTSVSSSYLDTSATIGTQYYYQVASVNGSGTSSYSPSEPSSIVACLPGQINLGYIRYQAQLRADKLNSPYLTLDEWNSNINQKCYELYDLLVSKFGEDYFQSVPLYLTLSGAISYPLPDGALYSAAPAFYKLTGIDINISGGNGQGNQLNAIWQPVPRSNWSDRDRWTAWPGSPSILNGANMTSYRVMGNQLFIFPQNMNTQIRFWYIPLMTQLLQDTDMLTFSLSGWSEYVIIKTAMLAMSKEVSSEKYQLLQTQLDTQIERIETIAANRDVGQPNSVSNVRGTMQDPGFAQGWGGMGFNNNGGGL